MRVNLFLSNKNFLQFQNLYVLHLEMFLENYFLNNHFNFPSVAFYGSNSNFLIALYDPATMWRPIVRHRTKLKGKRSYKVQEKAHTMQENLRLNDTDFVEPLTLFQYHETIVKRS